MTTTTNNGWICPQCHAVMSPWTPTCVNCKGNVEKCDKNHSQQKNNLLYDTENVKMTTSSESPLLVPGSVYFNPNLMKPTYKDEYGYYYYGPGV